MASDRDFTFTVAETKLLNLCFQHMKTAPDIDFDAVAAAYGYKDGAMARTRFGQVRQRIAKAKGGAAPGGGGANTDTPAKAPKSGTKTGKAATKATGTTKRKSTAKAAASDDEGGAESDRDKSPKSPSKKAKAGNGPVFPNLPTPMPAESMKRGRPTKATKAGGKKVSAAAKDEEDAEEDVTAGVKEEDAEVNSDAA